jgi:hypothetical protein
LYWLNQIEYFPNFQALSAFRILFAGYLFVHFVNVLPYYADLYGAAGVIPLAALATDHSIYGAARLAPLLSFLDAAGIGTILPIVFPLSLIALAAGYRTRWACGIALALDAYLYWRNPLAATGAEVLARLLLLWCLFLPINRYWCVDAALDHLPRRRDWPALPFVAIRLQIASLYFFSALFKLEGEPWQDGYALIWALQDTAYAATPVGLFFVNFAPGVLIAVNYVVVAFQLAFPYLVYNPWRNELTRGIAIHCSALMHLSFVVFLNIGGFPYLCLIMLVLLVPDKWIDRILERRRNLLRGLTIYFQPSCTFCAKMARILREFLLVPDAKVLPASADDAALRLLTRHNSWVVRDPKDNMHLKWRAVAYVLKRHPLTALLGWLTDVPVVRPTMARLYDYIGANRGALGTATRIVLPFHSDRPVGRCGLALNGGLATLALLCNLVSLDQWAPARPGQRIDFANYAGVHNALEELLAALQIRQDWSLFAPIPTHFYWSFRFNAINAEGKQVDVTAVMPFLAVSNEGRVSLNHVYWTLYFHRADDFSESQWEALGAYLCRVVARTYKPATAVEVTIGRAPVPYPIRGTAGEIGRRLSCPLPAT